MNGNWDTSYTPSLLFAVCLQVLLLALLSCTHLFPFALIPAAAYWVVTPIVIYRHPRPTKFDLIMVRSGYVIYFILTFFALFIPPFRN